MFKITKKVIIKKTNAPKVNETGLEEIEITPEIKKEVIAWAKEQVITPEEKFEAGLDKCLANIYALYERKTLTKEEIIPIFRASIA